MSELRDDVPVLSASGLCKVFDDGRLHLLVLQTTFAPSDARRSRAHWP